MYFFSLKLLLFSILIFIPSCYAVRKKTNEVFNRVLIDVNSAKQVFDGIGAVSGGGATSKLLFTYFPKEEQRKKIFEVLFNKDNGLQMLKVEMGGDDQSTEGSESSHMSQRGILSWRSYEFQLMAEARKVNPTLPICTLPWTFPGWLGKSPYDNVTETAEYVVDWLRIARKVYNIEVYCVGVWNERNFSELYVKELRKVLDRTSFGNVKIVAGEGFQMDESYPRLLDKGFINDYDIIGVHYPGGKIPDEVRKSGKTIWASEDFSTDNRETGEGCMARTINWNYVHGNITGMLAWHLTSAFNPSIAWYRCGLSYLDDNHFETENSFDVLRYTTGHTKRGWKILAHESGSGYFERGGTFVSYTNGEHLTIVFETMSYENSLCEYSSPRKYKVAEFQSVTFEILGDFHGLNVSLNYGESRYIKIGNNYLHLTIPSDSVGILTTLPINLPKKARISVEGLETEYFDDFSDYKFGEEPRFWMPQKGSWEVQNGVAVQKVEEPPISWCTGNVRTPYAVMGFRGKKTKISGKVMIPSGSNATSAIFGLRSNCSGCDIEVKNCNGLFMEIGFTSKNLTISFFSKFVYRVDHGEQFLGILSEADVFYNITLYYDYNNLRYSINNLKGWSYIPYTDVENDSFFLIGTGNFGVSHWDDLRVE